MKREQGFKTSRRSAQQGFTASWRSAQQGFTASWRSAQQGFTLIEMLVALAVFSLAALALLKLEGTTLANAATLEARATGQIVARNVAVETLADPMPPSLGVTEGQEANGGRTWRWTRATSNTDDQEVLRVDIAVFDETARPAASLTVVRPASYAIPQPQVDVPETRGS